MNENVLNRLISENELVKDDELRELMHESWDMIFQFLGKENFERWINKRELSDRIKNMAIEEFSDEDKERNPNADGFYTRGTDRIKLLSKVLGVNIHETYHFISDHKTKEHFPTFINEGLTEYLNISTSEPVRGVSYQKNVQMAKLLHVCLGDSIIKAYLTGEIRSNASFISSFCELVSNDGNNNIEELDNFFEDLQKMHTQLYSAREENINNAEYDNVNSNIQNYIQNIVVNYIGKKAGNLEYYSEGKLDANIIKKELSSLSRLAKDACVKLDFENVDFENDIYKRAITKIIENSHLVFGKENPKEYANELSEQLFQKSKYFTNESGTKQKNSIDFNTEVAQKVFENSENISLKIADLKLKDNYKILKDGNFNIAEFVSQISIIKQRTNMTDVELDNILGNYLLQNCPKGTDVKLIEDVVKDSLKPVFKLSEIEEDRNRNTIESRYIKLGRSEYIEKRDSQFYYIRFDKEGKFHEEKFYSTMDNNLKHEVKVRDLTAFQNGVIVLGTTREKCQLVTDRELSKIVMIHNKDGYNNELKHLASANDVKTDVILDALQEKINPKDYYRIQNDVENPYKIEGVFHTADVDLRSRKIDFDKYIREIKSVLGVVPVDKQNEFVEQNIENLLYRTYRVKQSENEDIYLSIKNGVKLALNEKNEDIYKRKINSLDKYSEELNEMRKTSVRESRKTSIVGFLTPEARRKYDLDVKRQQIKKLDIEEKEFLKNSDKYVIEKKPFKEDLIFPGVYYVGAFNCCTKKEVDINLLTSDIKDFLEKYPEGERKEKFEKFSNMFLGSFYGREEASRRNKENMSLRHDIYNEMKEMMKKSVWNNCEIEDSKFRELQGRAQEVAKNEYEYAYHRSALKYEDEETMKSYHKASEIMKRDDLPDDAKKMVVDSLIEANSMRLQSKKMLEEEKKLSQNCKSSDIQKQVDLIKNGLSKNIDIDKKQEQQR